MGGIDAGACRRDSDAVVERLIAHVDPLTGPSRKSLHTDSWSVQPLNGTSAIAEEFRGANDLETDVVNVCPNCVSRVAA
ncbi:MAG TPA: hypothetical protein EYP14_16405 [Planctomycetaceae bacterium]|nr:hypothetical protein [Planctomycetaceae bacterium]